MYDKTKAVCFSGHRTLYEPQEVIENRLEQTVRDCIFKGADTFIAGGALGFDMLAEHLILRLCLEYPHIRLALALPCPPEQQTLKWNDQQKADYKDIMERANYWSVLSKTYTSDCMLSRNRVMVDNSSTLIYYLRQNRGGTFYTVNYARKMGLYLLRI